MTITASVVSSERTSDRLPAQPKRRWGRIAAIAGSVLVLAGGGAFLALHGAKGGKDGSGAVKVQRGELAVVVSDTGTVQPMTKVDVKSRVAGQVAKLMVDAGDRVKKGDILLVLDTKDFERARAQAAADREIAAANYAKLAAGARPQEKEQARADLAQAQADLQRLEADFRRLGSAFGAFTAHDADQVRSDYEAGKARVAAARAKLNLVLIGNRPEDVAEAKAQLQKADVALKAADDQLSYATIRAPMDGIVTNRGVEVGSTVAPGVSALGNGTSIMTVADLKTLIVKTALNQIDVGKVRKGLPVEVRVDSAPGRVFHGTLTKVAPAAEVTSNNGTEIQTFPIETTLKGEEAHALKPGMTADIDIHVTSKKEALYLPVEAVVRGKGDDATVTLAPKGKGGKPTTRAVKIGLTNDHQVEIAKGLSEGQQVLIKPASAGDNTVKP